MVGFAELRDCDPGRYEQDASAWETQALALEEYDDLVRRMVGRLAEWEGPAGFLAKRRVSDLAAAFGDAPARLRTGAGALRRAGAEFQAAKDRLCRAVEDAEAQGYEVTDAGNVVPPTSAFATAVGIGPPQGAARRPENPAQSRLQDEIGAALRRAGRADEELRRALPLIQEGLAWEGDNPDLLSAAEAATLIQRAAGGDRTALAELERRTEQFSDPYFARELALILGPEGFVTLPSVVTEAIGGVHDGEGRALLGLLSDTLATATDPANPAWDCGAGGRQEFLENLKEQGRTGQHHIGGLPYDGYWGLGQIMHAGDGHPPYSAEFLAEVGNDMVDWDKEHHTTADWPYSAAPHDLGEGVGPLNSGADPLAGLMHAASSDPEGAQAILESGDGNSGDQPNNLTYLLRYREWPDTGDALGEAIEVAGGAETDNPRAAARIATQTVEILGAGLHQHPGHTEHSLGGLRDSVGAMLGSRINDVNVSINGSDIADVPGRFTHRDLSYVLEFATKDQAGYDALVTAELGHTRAAIDHAAAEGDVGQLGVAARNGSTALGAIIEARVDGLSEEARKQDELHGVLSQYSQKGLGLVSLTGPLGAAAGLAAAEITDKAFDLAAPNAQAQVHQQEATYHDQAKTALKDMVARSIADHQVYSEKNSPEAWLARQDDGSKSFIGDDGQPLSWDSLATDGMTYDTFDRWTQTLKSWTIGRGAGEDGFNAGCTWYTDERNKMLDRQ